MKRPDGWDELYLEAYRKEHTGYGSPERAMFDAGADAYEESLMKDKYSTKEVSIRYFEPLVVDDELITEVIFPDGWLVFIEKGVE